MIVRTARERWYDAHCNSPSSRSIIGGSGGGGGGGDLDSESKLVRSSLVSKNLGMKLGSIGGGGGCLSRDRLRFLDCLWCFALSGSRPLSACLSGLYFCEL